MGWQGEPLHEFNFADAIYADAHEELESGVEDESRISLVKALAGSASFTWVYDFGDYWAHKVKLERIVDLGQRTGHRESEDNGSAKESTLRMF